MTILLGVVLLFAALSAAVAAAQRACYATASCRSAPRTWIGSEAIGME